MSSAPFGLGRFETGASTRFDGVVVDERAVAPLAAVDPSWTRITDLFDDWAGAIARIGAVVEAMETPLRLDELRPLPPVRPAQILQAGANYRTHVIDLHIADAPDGSTPDEIAALRAEVGARLDRRARIGAPYL